MDDWARRHPLCNLFLNAALILGAVALLVFAVACAVLFLLACGNCGTW